MEERQRWKRENQREDKVQMPKEIFTTNLLENDAVGIDVRQVARGHQTKAARNLLENKQRTGQIRYGTIHAGNAVTSRQQEPLHLVLVAVQVGFTENGLGVESSESRLQSNKIRQDKIR